MTRGFLGESLIFLISQPRAGSTLLQRVLATHPQVHTASEPWLMLHPLYALRQEGYQAEYFAQSAWTALQSFLETLPGGKEDYYRGVRAMYGYLYRRALQDSGKQYFVDKTPRYYMVIPELFRTFPKAHYIILLRNPVAVLCSILNTWIPGNWLELHNFRHDLVRAPRLLLDGLECVGERGIAIRYEQFVEDPGRQLQQICNALGIGFVSEMLDYGKQGLPHWQFGDQESVYQQSSPIPEIAEKWTQSLDSPQMWRLMRDYLQLLGRDTVEKMGYAYTELESMLGSCRPHWVRRSLTVSLDWLLRKPPERRSAHTRALMRLGGSVRRRGSRGTASEIYRRTLDALSNSD